MRREPDFLIAGSRRAEKTWLSSFCAMLMLLWPTPLPSALASVPSTIHHVRDPAAAARRPTISTGIFSTSLWWLRCRISRRKVHLQDITITSSSTLSLAPPCLLLLPVLAPWRRQFLRRHRINRCRSLLTPMPLSQREQLPLPLRHPHPWLRFWLRCPSWLHRQQHRSQHRQFRHQFQ